MTDASNLVSLHSNDSMVGFTVEKNEVTNEQTCISSIDPTDPAHMTPGERVAEIATILADGVLRLRRRAAIPGDVPDSKIPPECGPVALITVPNHALMDTVVNAAAEAENGDIR